MTRYAGPSGHVAKADLERRGRVRADETSLHDRIARRAYELYEKRGRIPGYELQDWLEAEIVIRAERRFVSGAARPAQL